MAIRLYIIPRVFNSYRIVQPSDPTKCKTTLLSQSEALNDIAKGDKNVQIDSLREYPYNDELAHVLGYIGQISPDELETGEYTGYQPDTWVGQSGIEQQYEQQLHGQDGQALIEVNALGQKVRSLGQTDPVAGHNIV